MKKRRMPGHAQLSGSGSDSGSGSVLGGLEFGWCAFLKSEKLVGGRAGREVGLDLGLRRWVLVLTGITSQWATQNGAAQHNRAEESTQGHGGVGEVVGEVAGG